MFRVISVFSTNSYFIESHCFSAEVFCLDLCFVYPPEEAAPYLRWEPWITDNYSGDGNKHSSGPSKCCPPGIHLALYVLQPFILPEGPAGWVPMAARGQVT